MKTIDKIITKVNCKYGAPMGRSNVTPNFPFTILNIGAPHKFLVNRNTNKSQVIFDCAVPMNGAYDTGGAYWGLPCNLRVGYTKDLSYINFYRNETT